VLEILQRPETRENVRTVSEFFAEGFAELVRRHPGVIVGLRQMATVIGVEFDHPEGAVAASRGLYENGIWAIFSSLDKRVLQFKPGALMSRELCEEVLDRFDAAMPRIRALTAGLKNRS
jgi:acetylornithine/succinyldiaminopimelate/putrescine aminotransferase